MAKANWNPDDIQSLEAGEDIGKFLFLKMGTVNNTVKKATLGAVVLGSSHEFAYTTGQSVDVVFGGIPRVYAGGSITKGDLIMSDANGKATVATNGNWVAGEALHDAVDGQELAFKPLGYAKGVFTSYLSGSKTFDPASLTTLTQETTTITVTGAAFNDKVETSFSIDQAGVTLTGYVSAADTVTCIFFNGTSGTVNLGSGTLSVKVLKG